MAACLAALDDDRVCSHAHELFGQDQSRGEAQHPHRAGADALDRGNGRYAAGQHDVSDPLLDADIDQLHQLRMHRDQVDAERPRGERRSSGDFAAQQIGRHRAGGDDAEPAGIGDRGDQVALRHPGHRAAHDGEIGAEKGTAARPQPVQLGTAAIRHRSGGACAARSGFRPIGRGQSLTHPGASSPYAVCSARSASSVYSAAISTLTLISEVEITWMLIPLSASVWNICLATPASLRMPTPMTDILTTLGSGFSASKPSASRQPWRTSTARSRSARETVKVRSVLPSAEIFCTIMSTLIALSASGPKIAAATPGRSATRCTVIFASSRL